MRSGGDGGGIMSPLGVCVCVCVCRMRWLCAETLVTA